MGRQRQKEHYRVRPAPEESAPAPRSPRNPPTFQSPLPSTPCTILRFVEMPLLLIFGDRSLPHTCGLHIGDVHVKGIVQHASFVSDPFHLKLRPDIHPGCACGWLFSSACDISGCGLHRGRRQNNGHLSEMSASPPPGPMSGRVRGGGVKVAGGIRIADPVVKDFSRGTSLSVRRN